MSDILHSRRHKYTCEVSVISWWSVLLVEKTKVPGRNPLTCHKSLTNFIT